MKSRGQKAVIDRNDTNEFDKNIHNVRFHHAKSTYVHTLIHSIGILTNKSITIRQVLNNR